MAKYNWNDPEWGTDGSLSDTFSKPVTGVKYGMSSGLDLMSMLQTMAEDYYTPRRPDDGVSGTRPALIVHSQQIQIGDIPDPVLKDMIDNLSDNPSQSAELTSNILVVYAAPAGGVSSMLPKPKHENDIAAYVKYPRFYSFVDDNNKLTVSDAVKGKVCKVEILDNTTYSYGLYHGLIQSEGQLLSAGGLLNRAAVPLSSTFNNISNPISRVGDFMSSQIPFGMDEPFAANLPVYKPFSPEAIALFKEAAKIANLPLEWASDSSLHNILKKESRGEVGRPNYTYGQGSAGLRFGVTTRNIAKRTDVWPQIWSELKSGRKGAKSTATGLGQLILDNTDRYYPSKRAGIGVPIEEAVGMLRYIAARYKNPQRAWDFGFRRGGYKKIPGVWGGY